MTPITAKRQAYAKQLPLPTVQVVSQDVHPLNRKVVRSFRAEEEDHTFLMTIKINGDMPSESAILDAIAFFRDSNIEELTITKVKK